jgi:hypothetical protein
MSELDQAADTFLQKKMIKKHPTDRPWITNNIKHWISRRQSVFQKHARKNSKVFSFWRSKVQRAIHSAKSNYFHSKVADVDIVVKWWKEIKKLSGQNVRQQ